MQQISTQKCKQFMSETMSCFLERDKLFLQARYLTARRVFLKTSSGIFKNDSAKHKFH